MASEKQRIRDLFRTLNLLTYDDLLCLAHYWGIIGARELEDRLGYVPNDSFFKPLRSRSQATTIEYMMVRNIISQIDNPDFMFKVIEQLDGRLPTEQKIENHVELHDKTQNSLLEEQKKLIAMEMQKERLKLTQDMMEEG